MQKHISKASKIPASCPYYVRMKWRGRIFEHAQEFFLVRRQPPQLVVEAGIAGPPSEDLVEARRQRLAARTAGGLPVGREIPVVAPDIFQRRIHPRAPELVAGLLLADQPLGVDPAQSMGIADIELAGIVAQDHGFGNAPGLGDRAPVRALRGDLHRIRKSFDAVNAECGQMRPPRLAVGKAPLPMRGEARDHFPRQLHSPHVVECGIIDGAGFFARAEMLEKVETALRAGRPELGEEIAADHRAVAVRRPMPGAGVVDVDPRRGFHANPQHVPLLLDDDPGVLVQKPPHLALGDVQAHVVQQCHNAVHRRLALVIQHDDQGQVADARRRADGDGHGGGDGRLARQRIVRDAVGRRNQPFPLLPGGGGMTEFAARLQGEAKRRGVILAQEIVVLSDGSKWIENTAKTLFAGMETTFILDQFHALKKLQDALKEMIADEAVRKAQLNG